MYLVTADEMRKMDHQTIADYGIPGRLLMETAGRKAAEMLAKRFPGPASKHLLILAGPGNNGGDALVVARYFAGRAETVTTWVLAPDHRITGDARTNLDLLIALAPHYPGLVIHRVTDAEACRQALGDLEQYDVIVDGILGTGLQSDVRGFFPDLIQAVNDSGLPILSLDIASGLDSDTGHPRGCCIHADATATFGSAKAGHFLGSGRTWTGELKVMDIGIPDHIARPPMPALSVTDEQSVGAELVIRTPDSHKGTYGHLLVAAGARGTSGAAILCVKGALCVGTGLVTAAVPAGINPIVEMAAIEAMTKPINDHDQGALPLSALQEIVELSRRRTCTALGPGIGTADDTRQLVTELVDTIDVPLVLDADGLNCITEDLNRLKQRKAPTIITPHPGEMARLCRVSTADVQADRLGVARNFAMAHGVIVVLKGSGTLTVTADGNAFFCPAGNAGMASGGMGDLLTGMIAGLVAQGMPPETAARIAPFIHGRAGELVAARKAPFGFIATHLLDVIPEVLKGLMVYSGDLS